jgi:outer membrane protein OmpA-like peptidoglycan-associated protein
LALNTQEGINLKYDYDYTTVTLQGKVSSKKQKEQVLELIKSIKGIETIKDEIQITPPKLTTNIYFKSGETQLGQEAQNKITDFAKKVKDLDENQAIFVTIFSDMKGSQTTNKHLSHQRALAIEKFLKEELKIKNPLSIEEKLAPPPDVNLEKEAQKARRATLSLTKASR